MLINVTSRRLGDKKSVGKIINETRTKVQKLENSIPSPSAGIADQAIKSANIGSGAVDNSSLGTGSITADKLASGSFNPSGPSSGRPKANPHADPIRKKCIPENVFPFPSLPPPLS